MGARLILIALCGASLVLAGCHQPSAATPLAEATAFAESSIQPAGEPLRLQGYVNDAAGTLSNAVEARLSSRLQMLEKQTGHQLVVVTTPSLGGEDISAYTRALGNRWGIGRKGVNDGVILLVAPNEHKVRIEVGKGLTVALPDALCKKIIEHDILPGFRAADIDAGVEKGVAAITPHLH
ncbi:TPM domain-containing protein [Novosphingobium sp. PhB165]|uniref:TPM domain-containing protein n=1 Tax=Novosphingobium sp. PhB165 TaxID=2485105 RepID=UPI0010529FC9|nr:TPM domain-containing protein [Novosphingobium sp. PhB165]